MIGSGTIEKSGRKLTMSSSLILQPLDALEVHVLVDNEVDPLSSYVQMGPGVEVSGRFADIALTSPFPAEHRGATKKEMRMECLCCGAHGLSLMIVCLTIQFYMNLVGLTGKRR